MEYLSKNSDEYIAVFNSEVKLDLKTNCSYSLSWPKVENEIKEIRIKIVFFISYALQRSGIWRGQLVAPPVLSVCRKTDLKRPLGVEFDNKLAALYAMLATAFFIIFLKNDDS